MIEISQIRGGKAIVDKLNVLKESGINSAVAIGMREGLSYLRDMSIQNLRIMSKSAGLSVDGESITNLDKWVINANQYGGSLTCTSQHAAIVEFGSPGGIKVDCTGYGYNGWPIGKQQGNEPVFRRTFTIQMGIGFLRSTVYSEWVQSCFKNILEYNLGRTINGLK